MNEIFVLSLAAGCAVLLNWAFRVLPGEKWQFLASVPRTRSHTGEWEGTNLTYYGFFNATAYTVAAGVFVVLMGACRIPYYGALVLVGALLALCIPASKGVARIVEKKRHTFTVGGASFVGILAAPAIVELVNQTAGRWWGFHAPLFGFLGAVAVAYAFGEGLGRLACISFGCCYGKPLRACHPTIQRIFRDRAFIFSGKTKKIAYAHGLDGEAVVLIQAVTAVLYIAVGLAGTYLFLSGFFRTSFAIALISTQAWRYVSEWFRADYRGDRRVSAYQWMSIAAIAYACVLMIFFRPQETPDCQVLAGIQALWHPVVILCLQGLWIFVFLFTGRSRVTAVSMTFRVREDRI